MTTASFRMIIGPDMTSLTYGWHSVGGPEVTEATLKYNPGIFDYVHQIPAGVRDCNTFTIQEAYVSDKGRNSLVEWFNICSAPTASAAGKLMPRRTASVYLADRSGEGKFLFTLRQMLPVRWKFFTDLNAVDPEIVTCEVEFAFEGVDALPIAVSI